MNVPKHALSRTPKTRKPSWRQSQGCRWSQQMGRRTFLAALTGGFVAAPLVAQAQQARKIYRIGLLFGQVPATFSGQWPFFERMRELGWIQGRDFVADYRLYGDRYERVPT